MYSPRSSIYVNKLPERKFWMTLNNQHHREWWFPLSGFAKVFPRKTPMCNYPEYARGKLLWWTAAPANFFTP